MNKNEAKTTPDRSIQVERVFKPQHQAMLAALRVVLGLPRTPTLLREDDK
ncbi:MAG: hypothetical protein NTU41_00870 [Chloroflexi bacterium]|nr:hypothetical protein [Chloroflexota bacterium]